MLFHVNFFLIQLGIFFLSKLLNGSYKASFLSFVSDCISSNTFLNFGTMLVWWSVIKEQLVGNTGKGLRTLSLLDSLVIHINRDIPRTQVIIVDALWREDAKAAFCLIVIWNIIIYHMRWILPIEILSVISCNKIQDFILRKSPKQRDFYIIDLPLALMTSFKLIHMKGIW